MTTGLQPGSDLQRLPTSDIGDVSIGRIIDWYSLRCCVPCGSCVPASVLSKDGRTSTYRMVAWEV